MKQKQRRKTIITNNRLKNSKDGGKLISMMWKVKPLTHRHINGKVASDAIPPPRPACLIHNRHMHPLPLTTGRNIAGEPIPAI